MISNRRVVFEQSRNWAWYKSITVHEIPLDDLRGLRWTTRELLKLPLSPFVGLDVLTRGPKMALPNVRGKTTTSLRGRVSIKVGNTASFADMGRHMSYSFKRQFATLRIMRPQARVLKHDLGKTLFSAWQGTTPHIEAKPAGRQAIPVHLAEDEVLAWQGDWVGLLGSISALWVTNRRVVLYRNDPLSWMASVVYEVALRPGVRLEPAAFGHSRLELLTGGDDGSPQLGNSIVASLLQTQKPVVTTGRSSAADVAAQVDGVISTLLAGMGEQQQTSEARRTTMGGSAALAAGESVRASYKVHLPGRTGAAAQLDVTNTRLLLRRSRVAQFVSQGSLYWSIPLDQFRHVLRFNRGEKCSVVIVTARPVSGQPALARVKGIWRAAQKVGLGVLAVSVAVFLVGLLHGHLAPPGAIIPVMAFLALGTAILWILAPSANLLDATCSYPVLTIAPGDDSGLPSELGSLVLDLREGTAIAATPTISVGQTGSSSSPSSWSPGQEAPPVRLASGEIVLRRYRLGDNADAWITTRRLVAAHRRRRDILVQDLFLEDLAGVEEHTVTGRRGGVSAILVTLLLGLILTLKVSPVFAPVAVGVLIVLVAPFRKHYLVPRPQSWTTPSRVVVGYRSVSRARGNVTSITVRAFNLGVVPPCPSGHGGLTWRARSALVEIPVAELDGQALRRELGMLVVEVRTMGATALGAATRSAPDHVNGSELLLATNEEVQRSWMLASLRSAKAQAVLTNQRLVATREVQMYGWRSKATWHIPVVDVHGFLERQMVYETRPKARALGCIGFMLIVPLIYRAIRHRVERLGWKDLRLLGIAPETVTERESTEPLRPFERRFDVMLPPPSAPLPLLLPIDIQREQGIIQDMRQALQAVREGT